MQVCSGLLDVEVLVLPGTAFGGKHTASMDIFKVAVRKFIMSLGILRLVVVDSQVPAAIFHKAMLANELVLLLRRGSVLAPCIPFIGYKVPIGDEFFRVIKGSVVQFYWH